MKDWWDTLLLFLLGIFFWIYAALVRRESRFGIILAIVLGVLGFLFFWAFLVRLHPAVPEIGRWIRVFLSGVLVVGIASLIYERWRVHNGN